MISSDLGLANGQAKITRNSLQLLEITQDFELFCNSSSDLQGVLVALLSSHGVALLATGQLDHGKFGNR